MYDLNVRPRSSRLKDQQQFLKRLIQMGWNTVALNTNAFGKISATSTRPSTAIPLDKDLLQEALRLRSTSLPECAIVNFRQFTRVTVAIDDHNDAQAINNSNDALKAFDIVAATPGNIKVFAHLCQHADLDIISLDFAHRSFATHKKLVIQDYTLWKLCSI